MKTDLSEVKAIFFDLDGTLIDTDDVAIERLAHRLKPFLGPKSDRTARWLLMRAETPGNWLVTILDKMGKDEQMLDITDRLRKRRGIMPASEFQLIHGVQDLILSLRERFKLGLVTTRSRYHIERFLEAYPEIATSFEVTCGRQDTGRLKPHPEPILYAAGRLGLPVHQCLMVGDTTVDIKAARRAGALSAGVLCGFGERGELEKAGAHIIVSTTADLIHIL
jgi:HAD superfamily hydrolase (TIGR01549 family)